MKAAIKIGKETKICNIPEVKAAIAEIKKSDNWQNVIDVLASVNEIFTFGRSNHSSIKVFHGVSSLNKVFHGVSSLNTVGDMVITVSMSIIGSVEIDAEFIVEGWIDNKPAMCRVSNICQWKDGWIWFGDNQHENGGAKSLYSYRIYYSEK